MEVGGPFGDGASRQFGVVDKVPRSLGWYWVCGSDYYLFGLIGIDHYEPVYWNYNCLSKVDGCLKVLGKPLNPGGRGMSSWPDFCKGGFRVYLLTVGGLGLWCLKICI